MPIRDPISAAKAALLAVAEIKAATEACDRGDTNMFDALDAIAVAIEGFQAADESFREAAWSGMRATRPRPGGGFQTRRRAVRPARST